MGGGIDAMVSSERLLGGELARAAEALLAESRPDPRDPALALQFAAVQGLLALYWELRHQQPEAHAADEEPDQVSSAWLSLDSSLGWVSALMCSAAPASRPLSA